MDETFTIPELESLCRAWLECSLENDEEQMLRKVLATSTLSSPDIDACRRAMGAEVALRHQRPGRRRRRVWLSAAASVALLAGLFTLAAHISAQRADDAVVFIAGKEITGNEARKIAERNMARDLQQMTTLLARAEQEVMQAKLLTNSNIKHQHNITQQ